MTEETLHQLEQEITTGLSVPDNDGCWQAVNKALDYLIAEGELPGALAPDQDAEGRAYNNGRVASLIDFRNFLREKFEATRVAANKKRPPKPT